MTPKRKRVVLGIGYPWYQGYGLILVNRKESQTPMALGRLPEGKYRLVLEPVTNKLERKK